MTGVRAPAWDRFWAKVDTSGDCWTWTGHLKRGYGTFRDASGKTVLAHRWSYEEMVGPIPDGLVIDHLCRNRSCIRPTHLEAKTRRANTLAPGSLALAAANKAKTHCVRGHALAGANIYAEPSRPRVRKCLICMRALTRARKGFSPSLVDAVKWMEAKYPELLEAS